MTPLSEENSSKQQSVQSTPRKARVDLFWKNRREKQAAAEVSWASTAFAVVEVREEVHKHDKTITYAVNPRSVVGLFPFKRNIAGDKCFMGNVSVHRKYMKKDARVLLIPGQICKLFDSGEEFFCLSSIILVSKEPLR